MFEVREYLEGDHSPFAAWFDGLDGATAARVNTYIKRMEAGNFGNSEGVGGGVSELKMDFGPGYRVYYGRDGKTLVILLGGGSKRHQSADIAKALGRWKDYSNRKRHVLPEDRSAKRDA